MKIIITRPNSNGTYDEVGMNNRVLLSTEARDLNRALRTRLRNLGTAWQGKSLRVEYWNSLHDAKPWMIDWVQF
jgi:hypothetical protein